MHPVTRSIISRTPRPLRPTVELVVRTVDDTFNDRVPGLAAEIAFYFLLSLIPLLVTLLAGIGLVGGWFHESWQADLITTIKDAAGVMFSDRTIQQTITPLLEDMVSRSAGSVFGIGFLITFVSASRALRVVSTAITIAYDLEATRKGWQQRLWGLGLTLGAILVGIAVVPLVVAGPGLGQSISDWAGGLPVLPELWRALYWPIAAVVATLLIGALYHFAAPWWTPFRRDLPGAVLAMIVWLAGSIGLRIYVGQTIASDTVYQPVAGPLVLLLWLYVSGLAVLLGAELNAEIERMWPTHRPRQHRLRTLEGFLTDQETGTVSEGEPTFVRRSSAPDGDGSDRDDTLEIAPRDP